jgi:hypothetical protein
MFLGFNLGVWILDYNLWDLVFGFVLGMAFWFLVVIQSFGLFLVAHLD